MVSERGHGRPYVSATSTAPPATSVPRRRAERPHVDRSEPVGPQAQLTGRVGERVGDAAEVPCRSGAVAPASASPGASPGGGGGTRRGGHGERGGAGLACRRRPHELVGIERDPRHQGRRRPVAPPPPPAAAVAAASAARTAAATSAACSSRATRLASRSTAASTRRSLAATQRAGAVGEGTDATEPPHDGRRCADGVGREASGGRDLGREPAHGCRLAEVGRGRVGGQGRAGSRGEAGGRCSAAGGAQGLGDARSLGTRRRERLRAGSPRPAAAPATGP